jgi:hypothetical protein
MQGACTHRSAERIDSLGCSCMGRISLNCVTVDHTRSSTGGRTVQRLERQLNAARRQRRQIDRKQREAERRLLTALDQQFDAADLATEGVIVLTVAGEGELAWAAIIGTADSRKIVGVTCSQTEEPCPSSLECEVFDEAFTVARYWWDKAGTALRPM